MEPVDQIRLSIYPRRIGMSTQLTIIHMGFLVFYGLRLPKLDMNA